MGYRNYNFFLVLILYISELTRSRFLLLTTKRMRENIYCDISGKIFNVLENYLHKSLIPRPTIILINLFRSLKIPFLYEECLQHLSLN